MKYVLKIILILTLFTGSAQNLIPNPSFEIYSTCPTVNAFNVATGWYSLSPTPDYFACSFGVPANPMGYQLPHSGLAYIGFANVESFGAKLVQPLVPNETYQIEAYVAKSNFGTGVADEINIYFSQDSICEETDLDLLPRTPLISGFGNLTDTINWTLVTGTYTASGCERYVAFDVKGVGTNYYYLDDISITAFNQSGYEPMDCESFLNVSAPNIFTPNNDGVNDLFQFTGIYNFSKFQSDNIQFESVILNRWGNVVARYKNQNVSWDGTSNGLPLPDGVYFYQVQTLRSICGEEEYFEGFFHLVR
jgi:gliding motility-associated-like protein